MHKRAGGTMFAFRAVNGDNMSMLPLTASSQFTLDSLGLEG